MATQPTFGMRRDALLQHLESVFALAQVLTANAESAVRLVEETYRRALASSDEFSSADEARDWLFRQLVLTRREVQNALEGPLTASSTEGGSEIPAGQTHELADFRRRLAERLVDRTLPSAFAALTSEQRLLLMLCEVERLDCEAAGHILEMEPLTACRRAEEARVALHRALFSSAGELERHLMESSLHGQWKRAALQRMAESELVAIPPTLRPSVLGISKKLADTNRIAPEVDLPVEQKESASTVWLRVGKRVGAVVALIALAGILGYGFTYLMKHEPDVSLISLSARQADGVEAGFETTSPEQAERFIFETLGERVTVPLIQQASLAGVSVSDVSDGAEVPVLVYREQDRTIVVFIYSYAFLDAHTQRLVLEKDILRQIEDEGNFDLHDLGDDKALVWRNRDDIYVAITSGDAEELRARISFPS